MREVRDEKCVLSGGFALEHRRLQSVEDHADAFAYEKRSEIWLAASNE